MTADMEYMNGIEMDLNNNFVVIIEINTKEEIANA